MSSTKSFNRRKHHLVGLIYDRDFWFQYVFYVLYAALLGFIVQIMILHFDVDDYLTVLGVQVVSLMMSAMIFTTIKEVSSPNKKKQLLYFIITDGPRWGMAYYRWIGTIDDDLWIFFVLSILSSLIGGWLYERVFALYKNKISMIKHYFKENS